MAHLASIFVVIMVALGLVGYTETRIDSNNLGASQTISSLTSYTNPDDADSLPIVDAANGTTKRITWGNATSSLGTYFSTIYSPIFSTSATLAGLLSDEEGTAGGFVRATSSVIQTPRINVGSDATGDMYYRNASGAFTRLGIGAGTSYYLRTSAGGIPEWDNNVLSTLNSASTTFLATTTISADSLTNRALILNGLAYRFPSSRGTANTALVENGSGTLTWGMPGQVLIGSISTSTAGTAGNFYATTTIAHNFGTVPRMVRISYSARGDSTVDNITTGTAFATSTTVSFGNAYCMGTNADTATGAVTGVSGGQLGTVYAGENTNARCANGAVYNIYLASLTTTQAQIEIRYVGGKAAANMELSYEIIQ